MDDLSAPSILAGLEAQGDPAKAEDMARYHKAQRRYLGVGNPVLNDLAKELRTQIAPDARLPLASDLWQSDIHEARVLAAKLLTQARIKPDDTATWQLIVSWVPDFDAWAIADHVAVAGSKRLVADHARLDEVERWVDSDFMWTRRAALVFTLPFTKSRHPKPDEIAARDRVLGWAVQIAESREWFLQKAVAWWLRELSKHDPDRVRAWLDTHGDQLKPFARNEAAKYI